MLGLKAHPPPVRRLEGGGQPADGADREIDSAGMPKAPAGAYSASPAMFAPLTDSVPIRVGPTKEAPPSVDVHRSLARSG